MYNVDAYLKSLTSNAAKLTKKVQDGIAENTKDFGFENQAHFLDTNEDKLSEIRKNLDSRYEKEKLDGLKRLIAMISKGRDVSEFFPDVVKNVASNSLEVRKLVYIYILRYAEQEQDLALLSINTFQKDLSDKNQLIRAMALRVMSGIKVPVISPIVMLGIKKCVTDLSPYVRKTSAHAIPKCYKLDPAQKDALIDIISAMLNDNSTFTIGSVLMAFNDVCPDRLDLLHIHFRKLCKMLVDMDEWGQITALDLLLRYSRTQFLNPIGKAVSPLKTPKAKPVAKSFYSDDDSDVSHQSDSESASESDDEGGVIDPDLSYLLKCAQPLLQSRNSQVVLCVVKLYQHLAPAEESYKLGRPLVRLLRGHREIQYVVLSNIEAIASQRPYVFDLHFQHFFVRSTDPVFIRNLKLEILTLIATDSNISAILRELQEYVKSSNKDFVTMAIQAIGRCASNIPDMTESCLSGLLKLSTSQSTAVVGESVVVIRRLLQQRPQDNSVIIRQLTNSLSTIQVPVARASIFWLVGQNCEQLPTIAPDVLREAAKSFCNEDDCAKLQILTLSGKLAALQGSTSKTIMLLFQYVLNMARYDLNYEVRDRARFLRALVLGEQPPATTSGKEEGATFDHSTIPNENQGEEGFGSYTDKELNLSDHVKQILLSQKLAPIQENPSHGRENYRIGSMSLALNRRVVGYEPLPDWPTVQPDPSVRRIAIQAEIVDARNDRTAFGSDDTHGRFNSGKNGVSSPKFGSNGAKVQSLDKFLDSSDESEEESESGTQDSDEDEVEDEDEEGEDDESEEEEESEEEDDDDGEEEEEEEEEGEDDETSSEEEPILPPKRR